ncbi:hypothetical protein [Peribacillus asahii]|uniref:hypothetical protein n=1 Tax=Peribacillus asahii TaxID=228899 RepID=UPI00381120F2
MRSDKNYVMIYDDFMNDVESYSHREQFYYVLFKSMVNGITRSSTINIDMMAGIMGLSSHSKNRTAMKELLVSMEEKKLLLLYEDIMMRKEISAKDVKATGVYHAKITEMSGHSFTKIYYEDIYKFLDSDEKSKDLMFSIYFNIIHRIFESESSSPYSYVTIDTIKKETGFDKKTIMKHIDNLKESKIIYYETVKEGVDKDKNYYVRWANRDVLIDILHPKEASA